MGCASARWPGSVARRSAPWPWTSVRGCTRPGRSARPVATRASAAGPVRASVIRPSPATPSSTVASTVAHSTGAVLGVGGPPADGAETVVGQVAALAVVRRRRAPAPTRSGPWRGATAGPTAAAAATAPPAALASTEASSSRAAGSAERRPATVANTKTGIVTKATRNTTGGSPRPEPHDDRGEVGHPRGDEDEHQDRLGGLLEEPRRGEQRADDEGDDQRR